MAAPKAVASVGQKVALRGFPKAAPMASQKVAQRAVLLVYLKADLKAVLTAAV
jgi:hypothetical protein